jgi:uncharacterized small protein (DUF1192 family)
MVTDDENIFGAPPRRAASFHEIGQPLDDLSVHQLDERIALLQAEIARLGEARKARQASLEAAPTFFKM